VKNKKKLMIVIVVGILCAGLFRAGMVVGAASSEPGSEGDPLITQSYLESRLKEVGAGTSTGSDSSDIYKKEVLDKNKELTVSAGGEIVLFSGNASVVGKNGLVNLSSGELFKTGNSAVKYNIYLSPASSSGMKASSSVTVFIKGSYSIK
jgi:hypothetical protein